MTTLVLDKSNYYSTNEAITNFIYENFGQRDWEIKSNVNDVKYAESSDGGFKFNYWSTDGLSLSIEITNIDFGFGSLNYNDNVLVLTEKPHLESDFTYGYKRSQYRAN